MPKRQFDEHSHAYDTFGNLYSAMSCNYVDQRKYMCLDKLHPVKLVKYRNREGKRKFRDYFAHITSVQKKQCQYTYEKILSVA
jgi:hypothetical protein